MWRRLGLWSLLAALLATQTLGLLHRMAHGPDALPALSAHADHGHGHSHSHGHNHGDEGHDGDHAEAPSVWSWLFGDHDGAMDCRLYDQLTPLDLATLVPIVVLPLFLPAYWLTFIEGEALARHAALFEARAPPSLR